MFTPQPQLPTPQKNNADRLAGIVSLNLSTKFIFENLGSVVHFILIGIERAMLQSSEMRVSVPVTPEIV